MKQHAACCFTEGHGGQLEARTQEIVYLTYRRVHQGYTHSSIVLELLERKELGP